MCKPSASEAVQTDQEAVLKASGIIIEDMGAEYGSEWADTWRWMHFGTDPETNEQFLIDFGEPEPTKEEAISCADTYLQHYNAGTLHLIAHD